MLVSRRMYHLQLHLLFCLFVCKRVVHVVASQDEVERDDIQHLLHLLKDLQNEFWSCPKGNPRLATPSRPHLTLSFAQTLNGKLAPLAVAPAAASQRLGSVHQEQDTTTTTMATKTLGASNYALSGPESMLMTHGIRSIHDGILIGGRTLSIDNPRLSNRLWNHGDCYHQPRPIVLDPTLTHLFHVSKTLRAKRLLVFYSNQITWSSLPWSLDDVDHDLLDGCEFVPCAVLDNGQLDLVQVLGILRESFGMKSVMVEGGASLLTSLLEQGLYDCLCVTIVPQLVEPGVSIANVAKSPLFLGRTVFCQKLGCDLVLVIQKVDNDREENT